MTVTVPTGGLRGEISAIPSKSDLHRQLICASLCQSPTKLISKETMAEDILATIDCLTALGAEVSYADGGYVVKPIDRDDLPKTCELHCRESGSTLRFFIPIIAALGVEGHFHMEGRLPERPLAPLDALLMEKGITFTKPERNILQISGKLKAGDYAIAGNVSSQYITGLLFALPLLEEESRLTITGNIESADYIEMTLSVQKIFGKVHGYQDQCYSISSGIYESPLTSQVDGDWSNAAFWLVAGALPKGHITMTGLRRDSLQGDKAVVEILKELGAKISWDGDTITVSEGKREALIIDAAPIPDLVPILSVVAAVAKGETLVKNAGRLRIKESDRLHAVVESLNALGAILTEGEDYIAIEGTESLSGGYADAWGDHRMAMMAAIAAGVSKNSITITGGEAVKKSYPAFWEDMKLLGKTLEVEA